jgi:hypothetical protein
MCTESSCSIPVVESAGNPYQELEQSAHGMARGEHGLRVGQPPGGHRRLESAEHLLGHGVEIRIRGQVAEGRIAQAQEKDMLRRYSSIASAGETAMR